ncbi:MAG TPA: nicotinate phosphoribosyltransferase [Steroidobacteraceae bacterium]|nr:nicotinate phosphoribosyltransferase [Steroidobacteraceae bacterium]
MISPTQTSAALLTDFYQLTMAQAYCELEMNETAVFELFVRRLPPTRRFLVAAGLEQALEHIEQLRFTVADLEFLSQLGSFQSRFLDRLGAVRFTGSVHAMPEGTPFFAGEPILRITAPILEAQLLESRLLNIIHFQTLIASKAARCVVASRGRRLIDFGMRRAHEANAGLFAARAAYLAGFEATATVEAGRRFGIPLSGTLAHSFIEAHDTEEQAFRNFVGTRTGATTLLIDTYDTQRAARLVAALANELRSGGSTRAIQSVRIDSGDLAAEARSVRSILDEHGCGDVKIVLSGGIDEHQIDALLSTGVPADVFGIGTSLDVSSDAPSLDMVYKLAEYAGKPRRKCSAGKATWPGAKQVFRERSAGGEYLRDRIALTGEPPEGQPLLAEVMRGGRRLAPARSLNAIREHCRGEIGALPGLLRELREGPDDYRVTVSDAVRALAESAE